MPQCAAFGCSARSEVLNKSDGITFHRFPKDVKKRRMWEHAVKRENFSASNYSVLCSLHFEKQYFVQGPCRMSLKDDAVPTLFPTLATDFQEKPGEGSNQNAVDLNNRKQAKKSENILNNGSQFVTSCKERSHAAPDINPRLNGINHVKSLNELLSMNAKQLPSFKNFIVLPFKNTKKGGKEKFLTVIVETAIGKFNPWVNYWCNKFFAYWLTDYPLCFISFCLYAQILNILYKKF